MLTIFFSLHRFFCGWFICCCCFCLVLFSLSVGNSHVSSGKFVRARSCIPLQRLFFKSKQNYWLLASLVVVVFFLYLFHRCSIFATFAWQCSFQRLSFFLSFSFHVRPARCRCAACHFNSFLFVLFHFEFSVVGVLLCIATSEMLLAIIVYPVFSVLVSRVVYWTLFFALLFHLEKCETKNRNMMMHVYKWQWRCFYI